MQQQISMLSQQYHTNAIYLLQEKIRKLEFKNDVDCSQLIKDYDILLQSQQSLQSIINKILNKQIRVKMEMVMVRIVILIYVKICKLLRNY